MRHPIGDYMQLTFILSRTVSKMSWNIGRIIFKVATLTFRSLHGTAPPYMTSQFTRVADLPNRRRLRSASSNQLDVPSFRLLTVDSRAFPIAGAKVWNTLPDDVTSAPSLSTFRRHL